MSDLSKEQQQELNAMSKQTQINRDRCERCIRAKVPGAVDMQQLIADQDERIALLRSVYVSPTMDG